jgi:hypothetical protein
MPRLINLTGHDITVVRADGTSITVRPADPSRPAHCTEVHEPAGDLDGIPIVRLHYSDVVGLPAPRTGIRYIVSLPVLLACPDRTDLLVPAGQTRIGPRLCHALAESIR